MRDTIIILMKYDEPEWKQTFDSAYETGCSIIIASRDGISGMAGAYNRALVWNLTSILKYKYIWFVSNITFTKEDFERLRNVMVNYPEIDCLHPMFASDHKHLRPDAFPGNSTIKEVPYVEFTAPLIKTKVFFPDSGRPDLFLDEDMPFVGHDLDWSYRAKQAGYTLAVCRSVEVGHTYIRKDKNGHQVTDIRAKIRKSWIEHTTNALIAKYGVDWKQKLKYDGAV